MCTYENLLNDAKTMGIDVTEVNFESNAKGLCKGNKIGIRKDMSVAEKACVLAEEIAHCQTTVSNILDQGNPNNRKQETSARKLAVDRLLDIEDLFRAANACCSTLYEVAEYLEVTEGFLLESIEVFKRRYGYSYTSDKKTIVFNDCGFYIIAEQKGELP